MCCYTHDAGFSLQEQVCRIQGHFQHPGARSSGVVGHVTLFLQVNSLILQNKILKIIYFFAAVTENYVPSELKGNYALSGHITPEGLQGP